MHAIHIKQPALTWTLGSAARRHVQQNGFAVDDIDLLVGASGGPKWLVLAGLDRRLFSEFLARRTRPLPTIASSIGSWRFACLGQRDPQRAIDRFLESYLQQSYSKDATAQDVSRVLDGVLSQLLGDTGADEILQHPFLRSQVVAVRARGWLESDRRLRQGAALAGSALVNLLSRRGLSAFFERALFADPRLAQIADFADTLPTRRIALAPANLELALRASGAVPLILAGVRDIPGAPAGVYRDGGVADYHFDAAITRPHGLVFYPHFYSRCIPGWFDKSLRWRHQPGSAWDNTLMVSPSPEFVARLPFGKIPDRKDFFALSDAERIRFWQKVVAESIALGDEFMEVVMQQKVAEQAA